VSQIVIAAQWPARHDDVARCASGLGAVNEALREFHPAFESMFRARDRLRDPLVPMPTDAAGFEVAITAGAVRDDTGHRPLAGAGYMAIWDDNTRRFEKAKVVLDCGMDTGGSILVFVPNEVAAAGATADQVQTLMERVIDAFEPDWANVADPDSPTWRNQRSASQVAESWMVFVPSTAAPSIEGIRATIRGSGVVFRVTEEWFSVSDPKQVARARGLARALQGAGMVPP
jgi:hypothetical protein